MKLILNSITLFLLTAISFQAHPANLRTNSETEGDHKAVGVSFARSDTDLGSTSPLLLSYGISLNVIESTIPLERYNRNEIYPVYLFSNIAIDYPVSPFLEFGIDLGDFIWDKLTDGDASDVDLYYSYGLTLTIEKSVSISFYHKTYDLYFNEIYDAAFQNVTLDLTGVSLSYYFD